MGGGVLGKVLGIVGLVLLFVTVFLILTGHGLSGGLVRGGRLSAPDESLSALSVVSMPINVSVFAVGPSPLLN